MKEIVIIRRKDTGKQFLGHAIVFDDLDKVFEFKTLELPWRQNERSVSCIPFGEYTVVKRTSAKFKEHFHVLNVHGRSFILIHVGNYHTDIEGCILPGVGLYDINGDGSLDVYSSGRTMNSLLEIMPDEFKLRIV